MKTDPAKFTKLYYYVPDLGQNWRNINFHSVIPKYELNDKRFLAEMCAKDAHTTFRMDLVSQRNKFDIVLMVEKDEIIGLDGKKLPSELRRKEIGRFSIEVDYEPTFKGTEI